MGVSSMSGPTPNKGYEAAVMQRMGSMLTAMGEMIPMVGATSEVGMLLMDTIKKFSKHVPAGANSPAAEQNDLRQRLMQSQQNAQTMQQARGAGAPGQAGQGGPPPQQMPQMPRAA
jgi:hypothetical protein